MWGTGIWAAALAEWRDWSQRGCWDAPRFPPLAVGSGGRTKTAVRELRFVTAAARGGRGGGRGKGHGTRTGRSAGSRVGKGRSGGSGLHLARPCVGLQGTEIPGLDQLCAHTPVLGRRHPVLWTAIPPSVPPLQRAGHSAHTTPETAAGACAPSLPQGHAAGTGTHRPSTSRRPPALPVPSHPSRCAPLL